MEGGGHGRARARPPGIFKRRQNPPRLGWPETASCGRDDDRNRQGPYFAVLYLFSQGGRTQVTMVMVQYIFETAFVKNDGGYAATVAVAMFVIVIAFSVLNFQALRARDAR